MRTLYLTDLGREGTEYTATGQSHVINCDAFGTTALCGYRIAGAYNVARTNPPRRVCRKCRHRSEQPTLKKLVAVHTEPRR